MYIQSQGVLRTARLYTNYFLKLGAKSIATKDINGFEGFFP